MRHFKRAITPAIIEALQDTPAVFLNGPRQAGKSTLAKEISELVMEDDYVTLDDASTLAAATYDPEGFLKNFNKSVVIDEIQLAPNLFRVLKKLIDQNRGRNSSPANGRYLLTGSANIMALPQLSDALVGRMQVITLYPLSGGEIAGVREGFIDALFEDKFNYSKIPFEPNVLETIITKATFPQITSEGISNKTKWFESYLSTLLQRDVRTLTQIEKIPALPNMLKLIAARVSSTLNDASLARDAALNTMTYRRYRLLLTLLFLLISVPPWYKNIGKRLIKSPKVYLTDTALLCYLLGVDIDQLRKSNPMLFGSVIENLVASELTKQLARENNGTLYHFRTQDDREINFIIERRNSELIAIEVKTRSSVTPDDFKVLKMLQASLGKKFVKGVVLYQGADILPFGKDLYAMPITTLWSLGTRIL